MGSRARRGTPFQARDQKLTPILTLPKNLIPNNQLRVHKIRVPLASPIPSVVNTNYCWLFGAPPLVRFGGAPLP
jgi:hypothetical protein